MEVCQNASNAVTGMVRNGALKYLRPSPPPPEALKIATLRGPSDLIFSNAWSYLIPLKKWMLPPQRFVRYSNLSQFQWPELVWNWRLILLRHSYLFHLRVNRAYLES